VETLLHIFLNLIGFGGHDGSGRGHRRLGPTASLTASQERGKQRSRDAKAKTPHGKSSQY
jgi:hypothetical protein